jgi:hypothetical protein
MFLISELLIVQIYLNMALHPRWMNYLKVYLLGWIAKVDGLCLVQVFKTY